jgi:hypothetical protein
MHTPRLGLCGGIDDLQARTTRRKFLQKFDEGAGLQVRLDVRADFRAMPNPFRHQTRTNSPSFAILCPCTAIRLLIGAGSRRRSAR